eukprot:15463838-Alexandrium_andersonii.AAC.1
MRFAKLCASRLKVVRFNRRRFIVGQFWGAAQENRAAIRVLFRVARALPVHVAQTCSHFTKLPRVSANV